MKLLKPTKRRPVSDDLIRRTLPHLSQVLRDAVTVQMLTGMRSEELVSMRPKDIHRAGRVQLSTGESIDVDAETKAARKANIIGPRESVWVYIPERHKTQHRGEWRAVALLPQVQGILTPYLARGEADHLWSPAESFRQYAARKRAKRQSKVPPSQQTRRRADPRKSPGRKFTASTYGSAITDVCEQHNIPRWTPHQLRHRAATEMAAGGDAALLRGAQAALGHKDIRTTQIYAQIAFGPAVAATAKLAK